MAASVTAVADGGALGGTSSETFSLTVSGSDPAAAILTTFAAVDDVINSATLNGDPCTDRGTADYQGAFLRSSVFGRAPAASGTVDVQFNGTAFGVVGALAMSGVDQSTPFDTAVPNNDHSALDNIDVTVPSASGDIVIAAATGETAGGETTTENGGQTVVHEVSDSGAGYSGAGSYKAGDSSVNVGYVFSQPINSCMVGVNVNAVPSGSSLPIFSKAPNILLRL
jgi:hypothetical protein